MNCKELFTILQQPLKVMPLEEKSASATQATLMVVCQLKEIACAGRTADKTAAALEPAVMVSSTSGPSSCLVDACCSSCVEHCQAAQCRAPHPALTVSSSLTHSAHEYRRCS